jgi:Zn finger protein HypA/HybF involved in hydrogenase expression
MSVLQSLKEAVGLAESRPEYRCTECGTTFYSASDPDSHWFQCPECESDDAELISE